MKFDPQGTESNLNIHNLMQTLEHLLNFYIYRKIQSSNCFYFSNVPVHFHSGRDGKWGRECSRQWGREVDFATPKNHNSFLQLFFSLHHLPTYKCCLSNGIRVSRTPQDPYMWPPAIQFRMRKEHLEFCCRRHSYVKSFQIELGPQRVQPRSNHNFRKCAESFFYWGRLDNNLRMNKKYF